MNKLIDEFVKEVTAHDNAFLLDCKEMHYLFTQSNIGKVKLVHGAYAYGKEFILEAIGTKLELIAVVCDRKVYITDQFFFDLWPSKFEEKDLPECTELFYDAVKKVNTYAGEKLFNEFYENLEVKTVPAKSVEKTARDRLLSLESKIPRVTHDTVFDANDVIKLMSGSIKTEAEANRIFEEKKEHWIKVKSENTKIAELIAKQKVAASWEIKMAEGLRSIPDAKSVTVTFELKGKKATEKVAPETIMRILREKDNFDSCHFCNQKRGARLLNELGASTWCHDDNSLRCKHITKIAYGKNEIYVKKEVTSDE